MPVAGARRTHSAIDVSGPQASGPRRPRGPRLASALVLASLVASASASLAAAGAPQSVVLVNRGAAAYTGEVVRLRGVDLAGADAAAVTVACGGAPVASQVEVTAGTRAVIVSAWLWVLAGVAGGGNVTCVVSTGAGSSAADAPASSDDPAPSPATVARVGDAFVLSNGLTSLAVAAAPAGAGDAPPPPFQGATVVGAGGGVIGGSVWNASGADFVGFAAAVTAAGPLFAVVFLNYSFAGGRAATWRVRLAAGQWGARVAEAHDVGIDAAVDLALHAGGADWAPSATLGNGWAWCDPSTTLNPQGLNYNMTQQVGPLAPIARLPGGSLGYMMPRWSQARDSRFYFGVREAAPAAAAAAVRTLGVLAVRGGAWAWPQFTSQSFETMRAHLCGPWSAGAGTAFVHLPLFGRRVYHLLAGPAANTSDAAVALALAYANAELDRVANVWDLEWPGVAPAPAGFAVPWFYDPKTNPTHPAVRHVGIALLASLAGGNATAPPAGTATLGAANAYCDPDWWGSYVGNASPENANFFTDWSKLCLGWALAVALRGHPRAAYWCAVARGVWEHDLRHSVTLPSGAGQESPGYESHALDSWIAEAPLLDAICPNASAPAAAHPRLRAAAAFLYRTSTPWAFHFLGPAAADNGDVLRGRFGLPLGDTHPTVINLSSIAARGFPPPSPPSAWASEELAGFGAVLQGGAGTPAEAFLALKASPNRVHNHGDQLSVHYASHGARIVIDIMAGYNPRPYQESWHNRLCFGAATATTTQNVDGYERLVAFEAGRAGAGAAAVAMGQLTSTRLQTLPADPPQPYLAVYPYTPLAAPLTYRRTAVLVPGAGGAPGARDYVVLVDAHNASALGVGAYGALCFFQQDGEVSRARGPGALDMGNGTVFFFAANGSSSVPVSLVADRWDLPSEGNENATRVRAFPAAGGAAPPTLFVTLL
jgi:hypothetical protein